MEATKHHRVTKLKYLLSETSERFHSSNTTTAFEYSNLHSGSLSIDIISTHIPFGFEHSKMKIHAILVKTTLSPSIMLSMDFHILLSGINTTVVNIKHDQYKKSKLDD